MKCAKIYNAIPLNEANNDKFLPRIKNPVDSETHADLITVGMMEQSSASTKQLNLIKALC